MSLNVAHHQAWEQILAIANNANFKETVVGSGNGLTQLIAMYKAAEGGSTPQANQTVARVTEAGKR